MDYKQLLTTLIKVCPLKAEEIPQNFDFINALVQKQALLDEFDNTIFLEIYNEIFSKHQKNDFLLAVASQFGKTLLSDSNSPNNVYISYYLQTGVMYGLNSVKKYGFLFELKIGIHKKGIFWSLVPDIKRITNQEIEEYFIIEDILKSKYGWSEN